MAKIAQNAKAAEEVVQLRAKVAELEGRLAKAVEVFEEQEAEIERLKSSPSKTRNR